MTKFKYALFFDFHTSTEIPDVGKTFDAEAYLTPVESASPASAKKK